MTEFQCYILQLLILLLNVIDNVNKIYHCLLLVSWSTYKHLLDNLFKEIIIFQDTSNSQQRQLK